MKAMVVLMMLLLSIAVVVAEEAPAGEEDAGVIGPENQVLYGLDRVADNIAIFLSRIGGEETHANMVRKVVAERRAEHLRLLRLKQDGEITGEEFAKMNVALQKSLKSNEERLAKAEQRVQEAQARKEAKAAERGSGGSADGGTRGKSGDAGSKGSSASGGKGGK